MQKAALSGLCVQSQLMILSVPASKTAPARDDNYSRLKEVGRPLSNAGKTFKCMSELLCGYDDPVGGCKRLCGGCGWHAAADAICAAAAPAAAANQHHHDPMNEEGM